MPGSEGLLSDAVELLRGQYFILIERPTLSGLVFVRTVVPIMLLIGAGALARKIGALRGGDERVLSAYVYFFALPSLFFVDLAETDFTSGSIRFVIAGIVPILVAIVVHVGVYLVFKLRRDTLYLLIFATIFGSLGFFGLPFMMFAFPDRGVERIATLSAASISALAVAVSILVLELYRLGEATIWQGVKAVLKVLAKNPLILSIMGGVVFSVVGIQVPGPLSDFLHMLGGSTGAVATFMLGVFLYGRQYKNLRQAFGLSLLRIVFMPVVALLAVGVFGLAGMDRYTLVLMHAMPVAISMIVLSQRYQFFEETIASLTLISTIGASVYLNLWLLLLGHG